MFTFASFWNDPRISAQLSEQFTSLLIPGLVMAAALWHWRPQDRKQVTRTLLFSVATFLGAALGGVLAALNIEPLANGLQKFSFFVGGLAAIRLFGLFLFRLILPLCRVTLLRILEDLAELAGYCAWLMICLHAAGVNLSSLVTTSAVLTAMLAFSMQDTLGNILGGLALQLDNSIKVGDWITVDDVTGCVVDIRWRYTAIQTRNWETIIIPNSQLMKGKFAVLGRRRDNPLLWRRWVYFEVGYEHFPGQVIDIAQNAVRSRHIANVAETPPASCILFDFNTNGARYGLYYWLIDLESDYATDSAVRRSVYAALQRAGIQIPYPKYQIHLTNKDENYGQNKRLRRIKERMDTLQHVELFNTLQDDELAVIAEQLIYAPFVQGDIIMRQGTIAHCLYIIKSGGTDIFLELPDGNRRQIDTTHGSCFLGEMGLMTGEPRSATVIANSEVLAYRLDKEPFQKVLSKRPEIATEISALLARRQTNIHNLQQRFDSESVSQLKNYQQNILERIRGFFKLTIV